MKYTTQKSTVNSGYLTIVAEKDFGDIKAGDVGGDIQAESCLSQEGNCWVYPGSKVAKTSVVLDDAIVGNAKGAFTNIMGHCTIKDAAVVVGASVYWSEISHTAIVNGTENEDDYNAAPAKKTNIALISNSVIKGSAVVLRKVEIKGGSNISGGVLNGYINNAPSAENLLIVDEEIFGGMHELTKTQEGIKRLDNNEQTQNTASKALRNIHNIKK